MSTAGIPCAAIDIGIIIFNERAILGPTIEALLAAGFDSFVVLDMGSTDGTVDYLRTTLGGRMKLVDFPRRSLIEYGYGEARNACAIFSTREWLLFVDADEVLLPGGVENGRVRVRSEGRNPALYAIERKNLVRDHTGGPDGVKVGSVETHTRLYKPSMRMRYRGYIHEEIFVADASGYLDGGETELVFDHYSHLKPVVDAELKAGLYALMLMRAYNQPDVRQGTNPWWFDTYVPSHLATTKARADAFATKLGIPSRFYGPHPFQRTEDVMSALVPCPVTPAGQPEVTFDLGTLRTLHSAPCGQWLGRPARALWGEWNHPGEGSRSLTSIIESAQTWHWDRFIKPGSVAIDIGGHSGDTAIPMALFSYDKAAGRKGHVVVVEPNPAVVPVLNVNLALNTHIGHFHSLMAAVTAADVDEIELADHGNAQCNGGVLRESNLSVEVSEKLLQAAGVTYRTPGISMATLFKHIENHVTRDPVGFIKIDCEGYDKEIIRPCRDLFAAHKPVLFVEWFNWFTPEDDADLFAVIEAIGYVPYEPGTLGPAVATRRTSDLVCFHRDLPGPTA